MASPKPNPTGVLSPVAIDELAGIWQWNAKPYGVAHADAYLRYLKRAIDRLATNHAQGRTVGIRPDLQYILVRRQTKGHGQVAVYQTAAEQVNVLHVFHTAQDWQSKRFFESPSI